MPRMRKKDTEKAMRLIEEGKIGEGVIMCITRKCPYCNREVYLIYWKDHSCYWRRLEGAFLDGIKDLVQEQAEELVFGLIGIEEDYDEFEIRPIQNLRWDFIFNYMQKSNLEWMGEM